MADGVRGRVAGDRRGPVPGDKGGDLQSPRRRRKTTQFLPRLSRGIATTRRSTSNRLDSTFYIPWANDHHPGIQQALAERSADPGTAAARKCLQQIHTIASPNCSVASACQPRLRWILDCACSAYSDPIPISSLALGAGAKGRSVAAPNSSGIVGAIASNSAKYMKKFALAHSPL
jgi:hypothetical protein